MSLSKKPFMIFSLIRRFPSSCCLWGLFPDRFLPYLGLGGAASRGVRLGMSASLIGFISSVHFYAYAFLQPVSGVLHDRYGPVRVVIFGLLLTAASCLLLTLVRTPFTLGAWRLLSGFGVAPMYSAVLVFQAFAFPPERYCFYAAINLGLSSLGAIVSVAPLGFAVDVFGMTETFALLVAPPLIMALLLVKKASKDPIRLSREEKSKEGIRSLLS